MKKAASGIAPIISLDRDGSKPIHRQIYDSYRAAIVGGSLRPGQRIPSTRVLASEIGVSRFPVLNAYAQLLAEGYFESRVGAGTVVSGAIPDQLTSSQLTSSPVNGGAPRVIRNRAASGGAATPAVGDASPWMSVWGAFRVGQVAFDQFPMQVWSNLIARRCKRMTPQAAHYGLHMGSPMLREAIANYLRIARSARCEADQVMIVNGSQHALELAARALFEPGSHIWMEDPGYRLAREAFTLNQWQLVPVPVDREGLEVVAGIRKCRGARAAFVSPSHQFPLGVTMSASRRLQLLDWAHHSGAWIIEDDYDAEYRYESLPIASLQGLDNNSRVIYVGTFSKVMFPSLRLGYLVIPRELVGRFLRIRRIMDLGPPTFFQEVLADFIEEGHFARHLRRMRVLYGEIRKVLVERLIRDMDDMIEVAGDEAGMHLTVMLKNRLNDREIAERAAQQKISVFPLSPSYLGGKPRQGFILGFGGTTAQEIPGAVRRLRGVMS